MHGSPGRGLRTLIVVYTYKLHRVRARVCRNARFVYIPYNDLVFYLLSTGEYDELAGEVQVWVGGG